MNTVTLICQGCGRPFEIAQVDYDRMLNESMQAPRFLLSVVLHQLFIAMVWRTPTKCL